VRHIAHLISALPPRLRTPPAESDFRSAAHHRSVTARVGRWLGIAFAVCFVTGLLSHGIQHPPSWFFWPSRPVNLYRFTQGLHVATGIACIPLLLAKLWTVFPKLFSRPRVRSLPHAIERASVLVLSGAAFFELITGLFNVFQNYPWPFFFPTIHYAIAWVAIGSILVHVAVKLPVIRAGLGERPATGPNVDGGLSRRGFLRATWVTTGAAVLATVGGTVSFLRPVSVLATRSVGGAPQGVPVNRTAAHAHVIVSATDPYWRLRLRTATAEHQFSLADLHTMRQATAALPIACVEGWSASATWTGVPITELLRAVGVAPGTPIRVHSLEQGSIYATSTLPGEHTADPLSLLALALNGQPLDLDHGYPARIIAPSRPGVLQTKWVSRIEVIDQ
jgi:DMSO/TMAO reductase YedYZ molybdopterin-dependent catalytic subunit